MSPHHLRSTLINKSILVPHYNIKLVQFSFFSLLKSNDVQGYGLSKMPISLSLWIRQNHLSQLPFCKPMYDHQRFVFLKKQACYIVGNRIQWRKDVPMYNHPGYVFFKKQACYIVGNHIQLGKMSMIGLSTISLKRSIFHTFGVSKENLRLDPLLDMYMHWTPSTRV